MLSRRSPQWGSRHAAISAQVDLNVQVDLNADRGHRVSRENVQIETRGISVTVEINFGLTWNRCLCWLCIRCQFGFGSVSVRFNFKKWADQQTLLLKVNTCAFLLVGRLEFGETLSKLWLTLLIDSLFLTPGNLSTRAIDLGYCNGLCVHDFRDSRTFQSKFTPEAVLFHSVPRHCWWAEN